MTSASDFVIFAPMNHFKQSFLLDFFAFFSLKDHVALWHNCSFVSLAGVSPNFASQFSKNPPPRTPDKCDPDLSFDAVSELQQELLFFKGRYGGHHQAWQTWCQLEHPLKKLWQSYSVVSDSCGASTQISLKPASPWSEACGPVASRCTWTPSIKMWREMLFCFSKVK